MSARLVRDRIAEVPFRDEYAKNWLRPVASHAEHDSLLRKKLLEEVGEFLQAESGEGMIEEAADVLAVMEALIFKTRAWVDQNEEHRTISGLIVEAHRKKCEERGGFTRGVAWDV